MNLKVGCCSLAHKFATNSLSLHNFISLLVNNVQAAFSIAFDENKTNQSEISIVLLLNSNNNFEREWKLLNRINRHTETKWNFINTTVITVLFVRVYNELIFYDSDFSEIFVWQAKTKFFQAQADERKTLCDLIYIHRFQEMSMFNKISIFLQRN